MALVANDIVQVSYRGQYQNQRILFVSEWRVDTAAAGGTIEQDLLEVATMFGTTGAGTPASTYLACIGNNVTFEAVRAQVIYPGRSVYAQYGVTFTGSAGGNADTGNVATAVTRVTAVAGRNQVSTAHLGPIAAGDYTNGRISVSLFGRAAAFAIRWIQSVTTLPSGFTLKPTIFHRGAVAPPHWNDMTAYRVQDTVRTMHRRTVGLGE